MKNLLFSALIICLFLAAPGAYAEKNLKRKPSQTADQSISVNMVYGDKISAFLLSPNAQGAQVEFSNNFGRHDKKQISKADFDFLKKKISDLSYTNNIQYCPRSYTNVIVAGKKETLGCLGSPSKTAQELQKIVNLLALLF